jgi:pantothenate kinase
MDGFHLSDSMLVHSGARDRKGAPDTFDRAGYAAALERIRLGDASVYVPAFHRAIEDSIAAEIVVAPDVPLVITEGNYLLVWPEVRELLDEAWYLDVDDGVRLDRLVARHVAFGKPADVAREWAIQRDGVNASLIAEHRSHADLDVMSRGDLFTSRETNA